MRTLKCPLCLAFLLQARFPIRVVQLNKVQGQPFKIREIADKIRSILD